MRTTSEAPSPAGRRIEEILAQRPRRQALEGFEPIYSDIVDYILRCTHRIWEEKNVGLIDTHYGAACRLHTLAGPVIGVEAVKRNTLATMAAFPDRTLIGEDVIWSEDAPGLFYSSHRIASLMTHLGDDATFGLASGRRALAHTIADCVCVENRIVEEWLVRDNGWLARQLGRDIREIAQRQAAADRSADPLQHAWRMGEIERVRSRPALADRTDRPLARTFAQAWGIAFDRLLIGDAAQMYAPAADIAWPTGRRAFGPRGFAGLAASLLAALADVAFSVDHLAETALPEGETATAVRWSLAGFHAGAGAWGAPTGRELFILGVSHCRWRNGRILEERTIFDEIAVARQIAGGLGA